MWTGAENQITLMLIRHGVTRANKEKRYLGKTEEMLTKEGKEALLTDKLQNRYPKIELLFSSPMKRCLETAEIIYPNDTPVIISEWTEMDFGAFEGKNYMDLKEDARYQVWIDSNGTLPFPDGESREAFILRCEQGFDRMLKKCLEDRKTTVGAIVHGGTIMALLSQYDKGAYFSYQVPCGGGYICRFKQTAGKIVVKEIERL